MWLKIKQPGLRRLGLPFHLPWFHFGPPFLSHTHVKATTTHRANKAALGGGHMSRLQEIVGLCHLQGLLRSGDVSSQEDVEPESSTSSAATRQWPHIHTMHGRNPAPPKKPWNDDSPVNASKPWFPMVSKWCRILSIHSMYVCIWLSNAIVLAIRPPAWKMPLVAMKCYGYETPPPMAIKCHVVVNS